MVNGAAVGSGSGGGVLVGSSGTETFQSVSDQPSDPGRTSFVRSGGGGAAGGPTQAFLEAQAAAERAAETARQAEIQRVADKKATDIATEQKRIQDLAVRIKTQGGQQREFEATQRGTGETIAFQTTINPRTNERVVTRTNQTTGKVETKTFERSPASSGVQQSGGIIQTPAEGLLAPLDTGTIESSTASVGPAPTSVGLVSSNFEQAAAIGTRQFGQQSKFNPLKRTGEIEFVSPTFGTLSSEPLPRCPPPRWAKKLLHPLLSSHPPTPESESDWSCLPVGDQDRCRGTRAAVGSPDSLGQRGLEGRGTDSL